MNRQVIFTSDDFGLSHGVNTAVERAWREGLLTCASIMPGEAGFDEAVDIARRNQGLQVGLHLTLVQGRAVLPPEQLAGITDRNGNFPDNPVAAGMRYFFDAGLRTALRREIEAQIVRVRDAGINLTHIDGHLNIHLHPTVFGILSELMPVYGITSFRLSRERLVHNLKHGRERIAGKVTERAIFGSLARHALRELKLRSIGYAGEVKGVLNSGRMTEPYILSILDGLRDGLTELYFHPGCLPDGEITRRMPDYRHEEELASLTSPAVRHRLQELDIRVVNYRGDVKC